MLTEICQYPGEEEVMMRKEISQDAKRAAQTENPGRQVCLTQPQPDISV
jgi:hypothetical protein